MAFDSLIRLTIGADGSITINTGSNYNASNGISNTTNMNVGNITINTDGNTEIKSTGNVNVYSTKGTVEIDAEYGEVRLGKNVAKQLVNNLPICPVAGIEHCIGNTNVYV